ncbi:MAG: hypothetical protein U1E52_11195 [Geminicoccaceae bacterium]
MNSHRHWITATAFLATVGPASLGAAASPSLQYRYISLDATVPAGCQFFDPKAIDQAGRAYGGTACGGEPFIIRYENGTSTVLSKGFAWSGNHRGVVGGAVIDAQGTFQAALFSGGGTQLVRRQPDEVSSLVVDVSDNGIALVLSARATAGDPVTVYYLYRSGEARVLSHGQDDLNAQAVSDVGTVAGIVNGGKAFRLNPKSGAFNILEPLPTEPNSWGLGIHDNGDVLGYSFVFGGLERIGVWHGSQFDTYFVEGTPEYPTVSDRLLWSDRNMIVITNIFSPPEDFGGFVIPRPGTRVAIADLVPGLHTWTQIFDLNNQGDLVGWGGPGRFQIAESFLLQRVLGVDATAGAAPARAASIEKASAAVHTPAERRAITADRAGMFEAILGQSKADMR